MSKATPKTRTPDPNDSPSSHDRTAGCPRPNLRLVTILGSTREGRFGPKIARWFNDLAKRRDDFDLDAIDLAELDLPSVLTKTPNDTVVAYRERLAQADAFVVITPEYNHGYPAPLKQALDLAGNEWHAKPVALEASPVESVPPNNSVRSSPNCA